MAGVFIAAGAYAIALAVLLAGGFPPSDALIELALFAGVFPALAWWATRKAVRLPHDERSSRADLGLLAVIVVALSVFLVGGPQWIDHFFAGQPPLVREFVVVARKLLVFVAIPYLLYRTVSGYRWRDYGIHAAALRELGRSHLRVVLVTSAAFLAFNYFLGGAAEPVRTGKFSAGQLAIALPACFAWLLIEAGLVEEFFFRGVVQSRIAPWVGSQASAIALMALVFGLAHAPGFIYRGAGELEGLGDAPTALQAIAYAIVVIAPAGVTFGVIWARTRNLFAAMAVHAAVDLLPGVAHFVKVTGV